MPAYALVAGPAAMLFVGGVLLVETSHHLLVKASDGPAMRLLGMTYDANGAAVWIAIPVLLVVGGLLLKRLAPRVSEAYHGARQEALNQASNQRAAA